MRKDPRISINKLAEFMTAKPHRQHTIIRDQKKPSTFITSRYQLAYDAIKDYFLRTDMSSLQFAAAKMTSLAATTEWEQQNRDLCYDALVHFFKVSQLIQFENFTPSIGGFDAKMNISGVDVSIRPEIILKENDRIVGGIKLHINKSIQLDENSRAYIGTALMRYLSTEISTEQDVQRNACIVVDVFGGNVFTAPKAYKRTMKELEAACQTIALMWDAL